MAWLILVVWVAAFVAFGVAIGLTIRAALARRSAAAAVRPYVAPTALPAHAWRETTVDPVTAVRLTHLLYPTAHPQAIDPTHDTVDAPRVTTLNGIDFTVLRHVRRSQDDDEQSLECVYAAFPQASFPQASFPRLRVRARHGHGPSGELAAGDQTVQFESDAFNHVYDVSTEDPHYAYTVISGSMIEWFLAAPTLAVAVFDRADVLVAFETIETAIHTDVIEAELAYVVGMLDRMPARLWARSPEPLA